MIKLLVSDRMALAHMRVDRFCVETPFFPRQSVQAVNAASRKGTEASKGNNLAAQRSNYDICTSVFSCDTFSLQLVFNHDNDPL